MNLEDLDMVTWPQTRWFLDKSGNDIVNEIGRIERINPWWKKLCKDQGWPETPLKKRNATNHKPWREYYTPDMADIINREYAADFEFLKYKKLFTS